MVSPYKAAGEPELAFPGDSALNWYTRRLSTALSDRGLPVTVLTAQRPGGMRMFRDQSVDVRPVLDPRPLLFSLSLLREIFRQRQSTVHVQHELYAYPSLLDALILPILLGITRFAFRKCVVCTVHGVFAPKDIDSTLATSNRIAAPLPLVRAAWWWITAGLCRASTFVQVHERGQVATLVSAFACPAGKIVVIPIGVDKKERAAQDRAEKTILFFGSISARKGIAEFITALPDVLRRLPQNRIVIAGDVPARLRGALDLSRLCADAGVDMTRVALRGFIPDADIDELFASADVLILPYTMAIAASGPLSLGLGHGVPILTSSAFSADFPRAPGSFDPTPDDITNVLVRFYSEDTLRREITDYWRGLASQRSWDRVASDLKGAYDAFCCDRTTE